MTFRASLLHRKKKKSFEKYTEKWTEAKYTEKWAERNIQRSELSQVAKLGRHGSTQKDVVVQNPVGCTSEDCSWAYKERIGALFIKIHCCYYSWVRVDSWPRAVVNVPVIGKSAAITNLKKQAADFDMIKI